MRLRAFFTVEAALLLPLIMGFFLSVIYLLFYQYNRCLLEQECNILIVRETGLEGYEHSGLLRNLNRKISEINKEKYVSMGMQTFSVSVNGNTLSATGDGQVICPFWEVRIPDFFDWNLHVEVRHERLLPVQYIRRKRRLLGG